MSSAKTIASNALITVLPTDAEAISERNVQNSLALYVTDKLLRARYLIYWHLRDAVQTPDGWYYEWSANKAAYLADPVFHAAVLGAQGLLTLVGTYPAVPRFVQRLIDDTSVGPAEVISVPALSVEVSAPSPVRNAELGSTRKWRSRQLICDAFVRTDEEQAHLGDLLAVWFDAEQPLTIYDHAGGTLAAVGSLQVEQPRVSSAIVVQGTEATTYEVLLNARLTYCA